MKVHQDIRHEGTLDAADRKKMTFDEDSLAHIMSVLTDLYSNPELAVLREYSTNALDSHREAGNTDPIQIKLPTSMDPTLVIEDHGVGMSEDDIYNHFSKYGWSSKRETDEQTGMLGLGCKSALTLTSQFTLIATKDGETVTVLVTREGDGAGAVQVVDKCPAEGPGNGVTVQIPVQRGPNNTLFEGLTNRFFYFWSPGEVLVDGEQPEHMETLATQGMDPSEPAYGSSQVIKLDDDLFLSNRLDDDFLVMGNVAYPMDPWLGVDDDEKDRYGYSRRNRYSQLFEKRGVSNQWHIVAKVPIGSINFTPSREELHYTARTKDVVETVYEYVKRAVARIAQKDIEAQATHAKAFSRAEIWESVIGQRQFRYHGEDVPINGCIPLKKGNYAFTWSMGYGSDQPSQRLKDAITPSRVMPYLRKGTKPGTVIVTGVKMQGIPRSLKDSLLAWRKANKKAQDVQVAITSREPWAEPWLNGEVIHLTVDDLAPYKPQPKAKSARGKAPTYRILHNDMWNDLGDDLTTPLKAKTIYYMRAIRPNMTYGYRQIAQGVAEFDPKFGNADSETVVVVLRKRETPPFLHLYPQAIELDHWFDSKVREWEEAKSKAPQLTEESPPPNFWVELDESRVLDPELSAAIVKAKKLWKNTQSLGTKDYNFIRNACVVLNIQGPSIDMQKIRSTRQIPSVFLELETKYPGIRNIGFGKGADRLYEAINAVYFCRTFVNLP